MVERMLERGELLTSAALCERMNWAKQALSNALKAGRVFFIEVRGERVFPAFFADTTLERRRLEAVSRELGDLPGGAKLAFMTTPKASLSGKTPLEAIRDGSLAQVKASAEAFAER